MELLRQHRVSSGDGHDGMQHDLDKRSAAVGVDVQGSGRRIRVCLDDDAALGRDVQVAEHVALGEGADELLLGIPAFGIAVEGPGGRTLDRPLAAHAVDPNLVVPRESLVAGSAGAEIALPFDGNRERMVQLHRIPLVLRPQTQESAHPALSGSQLDSGV